MPGVETTGTRIFIDRACTPYVRPNVITRDDELRCSNDSIGLLVDFANRRMAVVYRYLTGSNPPKHWYSTGYQTYIYRMLKTLRRFGISEDEVGRCDTAIILCDSHEAVAVIAAAAHKMDSPFRYVLPILTNSCGAALLDDILTRGANTVLKDSFKDACEGIEGLSALPGRYHEKDAYIATIPNFAQMAKIHNYVVAYRCLPYIVCAKNQAEMYHVFLYRAIEAAKSRLYHSERFLRQLSSFDPADYIITTPNSDS